jgi:prolyl-tRNA editing enzyme YbaK/EbsC (Cys-tRNA(Pro) deacylase)
MPGRIETVNKKTTKKDDRISIVVKLTHDQHERLARFAERRGLSVGPLMRTIALEAAAEAAVLAVQGAKESRT